MILKRTIIVITIVIMTTVISAGLLILGNSKRKNNNVDIYSDSVNEIENVELSNEESIYNNSKEISTESEDKMIEQPKSDESSNNSNIIKEQSNNTSNNVKINNNPIIANDNININTNNNETNNTNKSKDVEKATENVVEKKEDVYTFAINNSEIQNMISIAKRLIRENKDNRYAGLVDCVDNINFVIEKSGNVFYPLYEYRIANIVMDNYYPEFYVYAEDIYQNGEYLRTEYYFQ